MSKCPARFLLCTILLLGSCAGTGLKCPYILLEVEADVFVAEADDCYVEIEIVPGRHPFLEDVEYKFTEPLSSKESHLKVQYYFDTVRPGGRFHHDCSGRPQSITATLYRAGIELDRNSLGFKDAFFEDTSGVHKLHLPIVLKEERAAADSG